MTGTPSRTARATPARRCLKEAVSELPARGTRSTYEAWKAWARRRRTPNPKVIRRPTRRCDGQVEGKSRVLPREIWRFTPEGHEGASEVSRSHKRRGSTPKGSAK